MSRTEFRITANIAGAAGWDKPLRTFFAQIYQIDEKGEPVEFINEDGELEATLRWVGTEPEEIRTVDDLEKRIDPYFLPEAVRNELLKIEFD